MTAIPDFLRDQEAIEAAELDTVTGKLDTIRHVQSTDAAEYFRVAGKSGPVTVRLSNRYPVAPLCLTCITFTCKHAEAVADYLIAKHMAAVAA